MYSFSLYWARLRSDAMGGPPWIIFFLLMGTLNNFVSSTVSVPSVAADTAATAETRNPIANWIFML